MKKLFYFFCILFPLASAAQEKEPSNFLVEGKTWVYGLFGFDDRNTICECKLQGDTIIDGIHFMRKYEKNYVVGGAVPEEWECTDWYLGQDGNRLYHFCSWSTFFNEKVLFMDLDFSKLPGDSIQANATLSQPWTFDVLAVSDTILENSSDMQQRRCMSVKSHTYEGTEDVWIEGIGSVTSGIMYYTLGNSFGKVPQLLSCHIGDEVLYEHPFDQQIPLSLTKVFAASADAPIYDLQGRRLSQRPVRGLYIQNGRKVLR